jgi:hypothetical protein
MRSVHIAVVLVARSSATASALGLDPGDHVVDREAFPRVEYLVQQGLPVREVPVKPPLVTPSSRASASTRTASGPPTARAVSPCSVRPLSPKT